MERDWGLSQVQQIARIEAQLKAVLDNIEEGVTILDGNYNVVRLNRAAARILGTDQQTLSNKEVTSLFEVFLPDGTPLPADQWPGNLALQGKFVHDFEIVVLRTDTGKAVIVEVTSSPILHESGLSEVLITYRDVTAPREVAQARSRLAAIVESSEDAIIGKDPQGIVTSWNKGAAKIFGYSVDEIVGKSIRHLIPDELQQQEDEILNHIRRGETVDHIETTRRKKDGTLIDVSLTISPIRDSAGNIVGASKIARDTTEKRRLERQLRQSQKMEAIGQLAGGIAHDFNNLLGIILGNLDLLERVLPENPAAHKRLQAARKAATRGADLTRRMLTFSSKEDLQPKSASLQDSIHSTIDLAARALGPEIRIVTHLQSSLPPVFVDVPGLETALLNLLVNARDAMPGGGSLTIATQLRQVEANYLPVQTGELKPGSYACVSVTDTGEGMSRAVLDRAFEPFFTTKPRHKGTGLGLPTVYGFVKQSGGTVRIYSEPGYGTTVELYLPLAAQAPAAARPETASPVPVASSGVVLVVDDEEDLLEIAIAYLEAMGFEAYGAPDGASALAILTQRHIDLLITDIMMPGGMNGVELVQKVRQITPGTRIAYCSGFPATTLAEKTIPLVDGPLLQKPYQYEEFSEIVRRLMDGEFPPLPKK